MKLAITQMVLGGLIVAGAVLSIPNIILGGLVLVIGIAQAANSKKIE